LANSDLTIALAGNPNTGKTSVFNALTGSTQAVGNWPGVTVEKKTGRMFADDVQAEIVDLPGTYSLSAFTEDEIVARDFLVKNTPDVAINVVDSTTLEHSFFLTLQLIELEVPLVIALNMQDEAQKKGIKIDSVKLSRILGVPVVETVGSTGRGMAELKKTAIQVGKSKQKSHYKVDFGTDIESSARKIECAISSDEVAKTSYKTHFFAHKLLEKDPQVEHELDSIAHSEKVHETVGMEIKKLAKIYGDDIETLVADRRYAAANGLAKMVTISSPQGKAEVTDAIDSVLINKFFGIIFFLVILWGIFQLTFFLGNPIGELIGTGLDRLGTWIKQALQALPWLGGMLHDAIINGVGGVLALFPNIFILFVFLSALEDSGYMARIAFVMDGLMSRIGLSGKAFVPFVIGFGCSVPAVMATRTLESKRDRIITILSAPLVTCSARMEVLVFVAGAFFGASAGNFVWAVVALSLALSVGTAKLFGLVLFKNQPPTPLLIELPPYRVPTIRSVLIHTWDRAKHFIKKAGGVILIGSLVFWVASSIPWGARLEDTIIGQIGHFISFVFTPLGLDWHASVALLFGIVAKEVVIAVFGQLGDGSHDNISKWYSASSALVLMVFLNLYTPCLATIAATKAEAGWKWATFQIAYSLALAWIMAFLTVKVSAIFL